MLLGNVEETRRGRIFCSIQFIIEMGIYSYSSSSSLLVYLIRSVIGHTLTLLFSILLLLHPVAHITSFSGRNYILNDLIMLRV